MRLIYQQYKKKSKAKTPAQYHPLTVVNPSVSKTLDNSIKTAQAPLSAIYENK